MLSSSTNEGAKLKDWARSHSLSRRDFLKLAVAGTAGAVGLSGSLGSLPAEETHLPFRTLGRTGLKVTTVGFGAILLSEPELIRAAFDRGINYVDTARTTSMGEVKRPSAGRSKGLEIEWW